MQEQIIFNMEGCLGSLQLSLTPPARSSIAPPTILSSSSSARVSRKAAQKSSRKKPSATASDGKVKERRGSTTKVKIEVEQPRRRAPKVPKPMPPNLPTVDENGNEITYTPVTHRPSKAKKGKRVHECEYAGCGKVSARRTLC